MKSLFIYRLLFSKDKELYRSLRNLMGFSPFNISLYKLAFSHRSAVTENVNGIDLSNERLEYLGDAVLGSVIADMLFRRYPFRDEGFLTEMRSRIVSREHLKSVALKIGLDKYIVKSSQPGMFRSMYGDAFEALIGAIYLDRGYGKARKFIIERIIRFHTDLDEIEQQDRNFKSKIINWGQRERKSVEFETVSEDPDSKLITVRLLIDGREVATGVDHVKKRAEQTAASVACEALGVE